MGQALIRCILQSERASLAAALVRADSALVGAPLSRFGIVDAPDVGFLGALNGDIAADVLVDFSGAHAFDAALALAIERRVGFLSGTTGLTEEQFASLRRAAQSIPVLWASNFSLGVAMLQCLARRAAAALPDWDCEIVELHHNRKQDAPSGTALTLGAAVAEGRQIALEEHARYERHGQVGTRAVGEIGFAALRGGDVAGEHTLLFISTGERIELTHRASSRDIFARGALTAALWLAGRAPGLYNIDQVLASEVPHVLVAPD